MVMGVDKTRKNDLVVRTRHLGVRMFPDQVGGRANFQNDPVFVQQRAVFNDVQGLPVFYPLDDPLGFYNFF